MKKDHGLPANNQDLVGKRPGPTPATWSLKTVIDRCEVVGECWLWKQCASQGVPQACIEGKSGTTVRRWVWQHVNGEVPQGMRVVSIVGCGDRLCCNPAHLKIISAAAQVKINLTEAVRRGAFSTPTARLQRRQRVEAGQAGDVTAKLNMAKARAIRADPRPTVEVATEYGIHRTHVNAIRRGKCWADWSGPFGGVAA